MILMDMMLLTGDNIQIGNEIPVEFINSYNKYNKKNNIDDSIFFNRHIKSNETIKTKIFVTEFLGRGSYGSVHKITINNLVCALKLSKNEHPKKMFKRYNSLISNHQLKKNIVETYCSGKIINNSKIYYSIMEYGGISLKKFQIDKTNVQNIIKQLHDIVSLSVNKRILIPDFKLSNMTINDNLQIKLIDYYLKCEEYEPCNNCKIIRSYSCVEYEKEHKIYENKQYNFTGIYIPFAICLINLLCENNIKNCCEKINEHFNLQLECKKIVLLLQIACFNFNNKTNSSIKKYKHMYKFKKAMENNYDILHDNNFYSYFIDLLVPKKEFIELFSYKKISLIINNLINLNPEQRTMKYIDENI
jgi:serine/threonine protein kinase